MGSDSLGNNKKKKPPSEKEPSTTSSTFQTALGIVPPDDVWDTIQRARYVAQDRSYGTWPPCLRLFHPFGTDVDALAFDVAACIAEYEIGSFDICLSEWSIIPHVEAMELTWWQQQQPQPPSSPAAASADDDVEPNVPLTIQQLRDLKERKEFAKLVQREERIGRLKLQERRIKQGLPAVEPSENNNNSREQQQQQQYMEFDGPCVICLEPDFESRQDLMTLRRVLQQDGGMGTRYSPFAPTATVDPTLVPATTGSRALGDFRPMIPMASFATVSEAIPVAQKLRQLWEPLQWEVTDLHILASTAFVVQDQNSNNDNEPQILGFAPKAAALSVDNQMMMGCSAMISLYGEEMEMDDELNKEIADLVAKTGQDGGGSGPSKTTKDSTQPSWSVSADDLNVRQHGAIEDIEAYLADDEETDYDEGTVVVIGRVHFFSGDARIYQGMPATSASLYDLPAALKKTNTTAKGGN